MPQNRSEEYLISEGRLAIFVYLFNINEETEEDVIDMVDVDAGSRYCRFVLPMTEIARHIAVPGKTGVGKPAAILLE